MNTIGSLIFVVLAFGFLLALRIVLLLVIRAGETQKKHIPNGYKPTVIKNDLFASNTNEKTP
jgi:hypothetical protein